MYKAAYGDLKVPTRFVVPSMAPWPGKCLLFMKVTDVIVLRFLILFDDFRGGVGYAIGKESRVNPIHWKVCG
jgi:hypothetical protein